MNRAIFLLAAMALALFATVTPSKVATANPFSFLFPRGIDVHAHKCDKCGNVHDPDGPCIERQAVKECVVGKKKVYKTKIRCKYVSIPETRYSWKKVRITKEIPCPYCKTVCKTEDCVHCYGEESWQKSCKRCGKSGCNGVGGISGLCTEQGGGSGGNACAGCTEVHCKKIRPRFEKVPSKRCTHEKGETTVKVHYWSCVKVPYTVYRQIKVPVCVKEPRYKKVKVSITKYDCACGPGKSCSRCKNASGSCCCASGSNCDGPAATSSDSYSEGEILSQDGETLADGSESLSTPPAASSTEDDSLLWGSGLRQE